MSEPDVGVIIYCKNDEDTINRAISSVLQQTIKPKNLVIIDDESNDKSWEIICNRLDVTNIDEVEIKTIINNINVMAKSNQFEDGLLQTLYSGSSEMWNKCEWFGFLKASDYFFDNKIKHSLSYLEDDNFCYVYSDFVYEKNGFPIRAYYSSHWTNHPDIGFFKKTILEKLNLDKTKAKTFDDLHKIIRQNFLVAHIPEALQYANYKT